MTGNVAVMMAGSADVLRLDDATIFASSAGTAFAGIRLNSDGQVYYSQSNVSGGAYIAQYNWITPTSSAANYDCQWVQNPDIPDTTPGAQSTDLNLGTTRTWEDTTPPAITAKTFQIRIQAVGSSTNLKTADITLDIEAI